MTTKYYERRNGAWEAFIGDLDTVLNSKYEKIKLLGSGAFGKVYLVKNRLTDEVFSMKELNPNSNKDLISVRDEIKNMEILSSSGNCNPYIVCFYEAYASYSFGKVYIIMEFVEGDDLTMLYKSLNSQMPVSQLWELIKQLSYGLFYIHSNNIGHLDIKLGNILFEARNSRYKYIDFGTSCDTKCTRFAAGTPNYIPLEKYEVMEGKQSTPKDVLRYNKAHDVWSLGMVFFCMSNRKLLGNLTNKKNPTRNDLYIFLRDYKYETIESNYTASNLVGITNEKINKLIESMLTIDIDDRPTINQVIEMIEDIESNI